MVTVDPIHAYKHQEVWFLQYNFGRWFFHFDCELHRRNDPWAAKSHFFQSLLVTIKSPGWTHPLGSGRVQHHKQFLWPAYPLDNWGGQGLTPSSDPRETRRLSWYWLNPFQPIFCSDISTQLSQHFQEFGLAQFYIEHEESLFDRECIRMGAGGLWTHRCLGHHIF